MKFLFTFDDGNSDNEVMVDYDNDKTFYGSSEKIVGIFSGKDFRECKEAAIEDIFDQIGDDPAPTYEEDDSEEAEKLREEERELKDKIEEGLGWYEYVDGGHNSTMHIG